MDPHPSPERFEPCPFTREHVLVHADRVRLFPFVAPIEAGETPEARTMRELWGLVRLRRDAPRTLETAAIPYRPGLVPARVRFAGIWFERLGGDGFAVASDLRTRGGRNLLEHDEEPLFCFSVPYVGTYPAPVFDGFVGGTPPTYRAWPDILPPNRLRVDVRLDHGEDLYFRLHLVAMEWESMGGARIGTVR